MVHFDPISFGWTSSGRQLDQPRTFPFPLTVLFIFLRHSSATSETRFFCCLPKTSGATVSTHLALDLESKAHRHPVLVLFKREIRIRTNDSLSRSLFRLPSIYESHYPSTALNTSHFVTLLLESTSPVTSTIMAPKSKTAVVEKRKSPYRADPNDHYQANMKRINEERMFIINVTDSGEYGDNGWSFGIRGTTGSNYRVNIGHTMTCDCTAFVSRCCVQTLHVSY